MRINNQCVIRVFTTPSDLRRLADEMESKWAASDYGDSLTAESVVIGETEINFIIDQEKMRYEEKLKNLQANL